MARIDNSINAQSTLALLHQLERRHAEAETIYVICDNTAYYRSTLVSDYLKDSKVELEFLPSYSFTLNVMERYWKFFKKKVLYNRVCEEVFRQPRRYLKELRSLLTENFQIIGARDQDPKTCSRWVYKNTSVTNLHSRFIWGRISAYMQV